MTGVFADTFYFVALMSENDAAHVRAIEASRVNRPVLTSEWILAEVGNALSNVSRRRMFPRLLSLLKKTDVRVYPATSTAFTAACAEYAARPDKEWSLIDCLSFQLMRELHLTDALTADHHFEQAGFRALLRV